MEDKHFDELLEQIVGGKHLHKMALVFICATDDLMPKIIMKVSQISLNFQVE